MISLMAYALPTLPSQCAPFMLVSKRDGRMKVADIP